MRPSDIGSMPTGGGRDHIMRGYGVGRARTAGRGALIGFGAVALLVFGTAAPASAAEVTIENLDIDSAFSLCDDESIGQSFTATATGAVTVLTLARGGPEAIVTLNLFAGDGTVGAPNATQQVSFPDEFADVRRTITLDAPFPVVAGEQYSFEFEGIPACQNQAHVYGASGYAGGTLFYDDTTSPGSDLAFAITIETTADADGDGVPDVLDRCAATTFSAGPGLKPNHVWATSAEGFVDRHETVLFTLADTDGCSAEQIIADAGLGKGHAKHGIPLGAIRDWIAALG